MQFVCLELQITAALEYMRKNMERKKKPPDKNGYYENPQLFMFRLNMSVIG